jgi:hypothetical protein
MRRDAAVPVVVKSACGDGYWGSYGGFSEYESLLLLFFLDIF